MDTRGVREGMIVRSTDGEKLGKVISCEEDRFVIVKGLLFPKEYRARYGDIADVRGDEILLRQSAAQFRAPGADASVPVREEEVDVQRRPVVREQVRTSRIAHQEELRASADVPREEVDVERERDVENQGPKRGEPPE